MKMRGNISRAFVESILNLSELIVRQTPEQTGNFFIFLQVPGLLFSILMVKIYR